MRFKIKPKITRALVLSKLSQEEIFERYLGIPVVFGKYVVNPLRSDKDPTCSFKWCGYSKDKLIFNDWSGWFCGDCFDLVQFIERVNFYDACRIILNDFGIIRGDVVRNRTPRKRIITAVEREGVEIRIKKRDWDSVDKAYWGSFGITSTQLKTFNVTAVQAVWMDGNKVYRRRSDNPAYAYYFGNGHFKIYMPFSKYSRFYSNFPSVQGYQQLPKEGEDLVITKSLKDVIVLYGHKVPAVAPHAESIFLSKGQFDELSNRFENIYSLYDFDYAGIRTINAARKQFNFTPLFLTGIKDISDYQKARGFDETDELIQSVSSW